MPPTRQVGWKCRNNPCPNCASWKSARATHSAIAASCSPISALKSSGSNRRAAIRRESLRRCSMPAMDAARADISPGSTPTNAASRRIRPARRRGKSACAAGQRRSPARCAASDRRQEIAALARGTRAVTARPLRHGDLVVRRARPLSRLCGDGFGVPQPRRPSQTLSAPSRGRRCYRATARSAWSRD